MKRISLFISVVAVAAHGCGDDDAPSAPAGVIIESSEGFAETFTEFDAWTGDIKDGMWVKFVPAFEGTLWAWELDGPCPQDHETVAVPPRTGRDSQSSLHPGKLAVLDLSAVGECAGKYVLSLEFDRSSRARRETAKATFRPRPEFWGGQALLSDWSAQPGSDNRGFVLIAGFNDPDATVFELAFYGAEGWIGNSFPEVAVNDASITLTGRHLSGERELPAGSYYIVAEGWYNQGGWYLQTLPLNLEQSLSFP